MNLGKGYFKEIFNKLNTADLILNSILSFCISVFLFYVFFPNKGYCSLKDFFVGETVYADYNKYYDIGFVFLYVLVFFLFGFVYKKIKSLCFTQKISQNSFCAKTAYPLQYVSLAGYLLLYPHDGHFYPLLAGLILILISAGVLEIKNKQKLTKTDGLIRFSYFSVTAFVLLCFARLYNLQQVFIDPHHDAEHFNVFLMQAKYNLQYYKDIMLVHGSRDAIESRLGVLFFGNDNLYTYFLGKTLYFNLLVIIFTFTALFVFKGSPAALIACAGLYKNDDLTVLFGIYLLVFLLLIKDKILNNKQLFLSLYILSAFLFVQYWTTMGILWMAAALPAAGYVLIKIFKDKDYKALTVPAITLLICTAVFAKDLYYFCRQAAFYAEGNLFGFGTVMPALKVTSFILYYKMAAIILLPVFMMLLLKGFTRSTGKNKDYIFTLGFTVLLIILSLNYTLGRLDADGFTRLLNVSLNLLFIMVPYIVCRFCKSQRLLNYAITVTVFLLIYFACNKLVDIKLTPQAPAPQANLLPKQGLLDLRNDEKQSLTDSLQFISKYMQKDDIFLELTNKGILYYMLDKKVPIPFTSYYNIVSDKQAKYALNKLKENEPDIIYMDDLSKKLDNAYPSLKINPIYRYLLLSNKYKLITQGDKALLVKNGQNNKFNGKELAVLDKMLAANNLKNLPDSWGKSINSLPVEETELNYVLQAAKTGGATLLNIHFNTPQKGQDIELIYIEVYNKNASNWIMQPNNTASILFYQTRSGKMLVPFDNFPSWLLNKTVTDITIKTDAQIDKPPVIKFYKRK